MIYVLAIIHLAELGANTPDRIEYKHAYVQLDDCWKGAQKLLDVMPPEEAIVVCLPEEV